MSVMEFLHRIINYLGQIQDDLIVYFFPVFASAFVAIITLGVHAIAQFMRQNMKFDNEQYQIIQEFYPSIQMRMLTLKLLIEEIESIPGCPSLKSAVKKYIAYERNPEEYCKNHQKEIHTIDRLTIAMTDFSNRITDFNRYFVDHAVPKPPVLHPFLRRKICKMLAVFWYESFLWDKYFRENMCLDIFEKKIMDLEKFWKVKLDGKEMERYLSLLDQWFLSYL